MISQVHALGAINAVSVDNRHGRSAVLPGRCTSRDEKGRDEKGCGHEVGWLTGAASIEGSVTAAPHARLRPSPADLRA
jgi:hypothetical protein